VLAWRGAKGSFPRVSFSDLYEEFNKSKRTRPADELARVQESLGDVYDRFRIRMMEIRESLKIIRQLLDRGMPAGPHIVDDPHVALPSKEACYNEMEAMIYHFKLIMDGIRVPEGEIYSMVEGANGELGFYTLSDGTGKPYRNHCRPPCFPIFSTFSQLIKGGSLSDAIVSLGGLNIVAGALER